ncbi:MULTISPECIES: phage tail protein [Bradyrhizobium]|jgi:microcystin-dependent protein|uniref:phage tail protein n=1 Tax=Bradyrhizobium TaxID=374 RepID=UPI0004BB664F|nr:tail fiber protein [Bradyrhizobium elkanii]WLA83485.1 tail fiber protein [Bradyrhizobium elkanii]
MSDQFLAEIRIFPLNFAPKGWAFCSGQLLPISQNTALFSLLGTVYGGDGKSNFALPNMQGNAPMAPGQGPGLSLYDLGENGGSGNVTLLQTEIPSHTHQMFGTVENGTQGTLTTNITLATSVGGTLYQTGTSANLVPTNTNAVAPAGNGLPHNNMQPYLTLNFCVALQGIFPARG